MQPSITKYLSQFQDIAIPRGYAPVGPKEGYILCITQLNSVYVTKQQRWEESKAVKDMKREKNGNDTCPFFLITRPKSYTISILLL